MKHIFIQFTVLMSIMGCGLMNNPKEDTKDEDKQIHVPQKVTVKIPDILEKDNNKTHLKEKHQKSKWYQ